MAFEVVRYRLKSEKVTGRLRLVFLSDLHNNRHGEGQKTLIRAVRRQRPDLILIGGDMLTARYPDNANGEALLKALPGIAPCFYANGNHESCLADAHPDRYENWCAFLADCGIRLLSNRSAECRVRGTDIRITGYEAPLDKFRKFRLPRLSAADLEEALGPAEDAFYNILLAHGPAFAEAYFARGEDLILCGHNHGGIMRLWGTRVLMSPYGFPLPRYGYGRITRGGQELIITAGLGEHTIPFRLRNPMEIVSVDIQGVNAYGAGN